MDYQKVGLLISTLRKEKGLTQKELADKLGITDRAVSKWERGHGCPDVSLLDDISKILDISILEILKGKRLQKEELIDNNKIIETINYSANNLKHKIKEYFNIISILIIVFISSLLLISNVKNIYDLNKNYYSNLDEERDNTIFDKYLINTKLIRDDQGNYSSDEYKLIITYLDNLNNELDIKSDQTFYNKTKYRFEEIIKYYDDFNIYFDIDIMKNEKEIYKMLNRHDSNIIENFIQFGYYTQSIDTLYIATANYINSISYGNITKEKDIITSTNRLIELDYQKRNMLLEDIIKVGDINE